MQSLKRVLFVSGTRGAGTLRYRVRLAEEALRARGIQTAACYFTDPRSALLLPDADVLALYRVPATPWLRELVRRAQLRGTPVTYDIDDLVFRPEHLDDLSFLPTLSEKERAGFYDAVPKRSIAARWATSGSATTRAIAGELAEFVQGPVEVLPNGVGRVALQLADRALRNETKSREISIGYFSGSNTHDADWLSIERDVADAMHQFPQTTLTLVGPVATSDALADFDTRVRRINFVDWRRLFAMLESVDISLAPLTAGPFTNGKSAIKWLESALVETPTIATATEPNADAITDGIDGILVPVSQSWLPALADLITNEEQRRSIGVAARESALRQFGPSVQAQRYEDYFNGVLADDRASEILPREPYRVPKAGPTLEGYDFPPDVNNEPWSPSMAARARLAGAQLRQLPARAAGRARRMAKRTRN